MKSLPKTHGLVAAPLTPMHPDGSINYDKIKDQAEIFCRNRISGVFICGTTGESMSLTIEERKQIAETWAQFIDPALRFIVHVGHDCFTYSKELARHAESIGAHAIGAHCPVFFKPPTLDALVVWFSELAAETKLPIYYYNIPSLTGVSLPACDFLKATTHLPNLAGVKFTFENMYDFGQCLDFQNGALDILFGRDEMLLSGLALGATGAVGSFYNFAAPLFYQMIDAFHAGDTTEAKMLQGKARQLVKIYFDHGASIATAKAMMKIAGIDCGPVRLPLTNLTTKEINKLETELDNFGFSDFCMQ